MVALERVTKTQRGGICIALLSLSLSLSLSNLGARWGWVIKARPWPLYPRERPGTHCIGGWVGPRVHVCTVLHKSYVTITATVQLNIL